MITDKRRIRIYFIILFAAISIYSSAQSFSSVRKAPNELSIHGGAGLLSFMPISSVFNGYALDLGMGYTYFLNSNWGIYAGVGPAIYHAKILENISVLTPNLTDRNGYIFDLQTTSDYTETHKTMFLNIPVMLQYQKIQKQLSGWKQMRGRQGFYVMGGVKACIPLNGQHESKNTALTNLAYYPELDNWAGTQRFAGLGEFDGKKLDGNIELAPFMMIALEAGIKWRLNRTLLLYTGAFFDYGLNNIAKNERAPFRNYVAVDQFTDFPLLAFPDRMNMMAAGIKLRLAFFREPTTGICPY